MRFAIVSDLHTDHAENQDALVQLAVAIHAGKADVVILAGDVSPRADRVERALKALLQVCKQLVFVPGNHDLWSDRQQVQQEATFDTWQRYRVELPQLCAELGAHYLPSGPWRAGGVGIAGSCGWSDHSFMLPEVRDKVAPDAFETKSWGGIQWSDARFVKFKHADGTPMDDVAVARVMERELGEHLSQLEADSSIREVVAVTHHLPFEELVVRSGTLPWEFFAAFMGSGGLGQVIRQYSKVSTVVHGHAHRPTDTQLYGRRILAAPLGYPRERRGEAPEALEALHLAWFELDPSAS